VILVFNFVAFHYSALVKGRINFEVICKHRTSVYSAGSSNWIRPWKTSQRREVYRLIAADPGGHDTVQNHLTDGESCLGTTRFNNKLKSLTPYVYAIPSPFVQIIKHHLGQDFCCADGHGNRELLGKKV
jgi:hypothetical protein